LIAVNINQTLESNKWEKRMKQNIKDEDERAQVYEKAIEMGLPVQI
jgi:hypothetical protein